MTKRGTLIVLCAACALAAGTDAAPSAAAVGTAPFTCKAGGTGFADAHCTTAASPGSFGHEAISEETKTEAEGNNEKTNSETNAAIPATLRATISGVNVEIRFPVWHYFGWWTWHRTVGNATWHGIIIIWFTSPVVVAPAGKGCKVKGNEVVSKELVTTSNEQGMALKIEPKEGAALATLEVEGCSISALNGTYELKGSLKGTPNGTLLEFTHAGVTEQGTLTVRGQKAGLEGKLTNYGRANGSQSFTPVAPTTVE